MKLLHGTDTPSEEMINDFPEEKDNSGINRDLELEELDGDKKFEEK